ncbi:T9SS type A sorting domain-containing protein [Flavobacterium sp. GT3R68]|uniref:T9SS type A sorting domain-containing protein n=1 Tax=Flavobacterium sp. GT3R68 TaxID=2594437 RepID=UPI000F8885CF|nr:T9SS type A sorting domain-containing protein [Flavobacterium sp. GT3R68]RTY86604.1 T9SS type A sorting domain-containing protein [Flavobacterium sp. GSN2]TRW92641.1 T9SS type A sorting domain-containing protein [Flavobacterium sp. GT3R68]
MKKLLFYRENSQWANRSLIHSVRVFVDCILKNLLKNTFSDLNLTLNYTKGLKTVSSICLLFLLSGLSINFAFAQQADLRDLTDAFEPGKCPADDIQTLSASIDTGIPCNTCTATSSVTADFTIRINHKTESGGRHLAICGTVVETLAGGGQVLHDISQCFGPLLKNSDQTGGGQDLAAGQLTFTCGSTLVLTDILLVWTAANGECPVTLANNPNGKYCWNNPDINIDPPFNASVTQVDAECYGSATGSINLTPVGGVPPYTYAWTTSDGAIPAGQEDDQDLSGLVAGTYDVTVTDSHDCTVSVLGTVIGQDSLILPDITKDPGSATTLCGVSATAAQAAIDTAFNTWLAVAPVASGGTPPYTVAITNPASPTDPVAPSFTGGITSVTWTVTDSCGQTDTVTAAFTVSNPCAPVCEITDTTNPACFGDTGSITAVASAGFPSYTFYLYDTSDLSQAVATSPAVDNDANQSFATYTFTGLSGGTYLVVITDSVDQTPIPDINSGCQNTITQPDAALSSTISDVDVLCYGAATGSIDLSPSGGTPPYTFAWTASNGGAIPAGQEDDEDLSGLVAGTYDVVITDANGTTGGCRATDQAVISQPNAALSSQISDVDVLCFGAATGSIDLTASGGTPPYTYAWTASNGGAIPAGQEDDQDLSGLVAGTYDVMITDANGTTGGCSATDQAVISQPGTASSSAISDVDVLCYGAATGSIDLTPSGGTPPYTYAWTASNGGIIPAGQADDEDLSGLVAGTYDVVITDANGTTEGCGSSNQAVISQPAAALSSTISDVDVLCFGAATGSINLSPSGGTPPYTYAWTASNGGVIPAGQADDQDLSGLVAGTYDVVITDTNGTAGGCRGANQAVISAPSAALAGSATPTAESCASHDGSIALTVSGGTPPYSYLWNNGATTEDLSGLTAGTYTVVITDASNCTANSGATVGAPTNCTGNEGCTLGYWKNHTNRWCSQYTTSMRFGAVFVNAPSNLANLTLLQALNLGGGGIYNLARQGVAALLNACSDEVDYPGPYFGNPQAVIDAVNAAYLAGGTSPGILASQLDALNNSGCPLHGTHATNDVVHEPIVNISIYPVPFKENITIRYDFNYKTDVRIEILNAQGKMLMSYDDPNPYLNKEVTLNVKSHNEVQMYFIKVITNKGVTIKKAMSRK